MDRINIRTGTRVVLVNEWYISNDIMMFDFDKPTVEEDMQVARALLEQYHNDGYFTITKIHTKMFNITRYYVNNSPYFLHDDEFTLLSTTCNTKFTLSKSSLKSNQTLGGNQQ